MVWDDEPIAAALTASEWGVRHGACRPFWSPLANLISPTEAMGCTIMRPNERKSRGCIEAVCGLGFCECAGREAALGN